MGGDLAVCGDRFCYAYAKNGQVTLCTVSADGTQDALTLPESAKLDSFWLTADGPLIIEANTIPGFNTAQYRGYAWVTDGYGYQPLFDELNGKPFVPNDHYARVLLKLD